ncbi:hypothetical protein L873DRAFT_1820426 [Choiromyces venosus 120613-1]|uniref:Uncharacterized protein n=1 Tax=Choiromyces venosus 120613-1 TaxID=1336337 RepID=A0A3N4J192_9PEZI|nr:hypothetical protein L873DRAFT_1820426 [Choiromyces venosus 120613-1]
MGGFPVKYVTASTWTTTWSPSHCEKSPGIGHSSQAGCNLPCFRSVCSSIPGPAATPVRNGCPPARTIRPRTESGGGPSKLSEGQSNRGGAPTKSVGFPARLGRHPGAPPTL